MHDWMDQAPALTMHLFIKITCGCCISARAPPQIQTTCKTFRFLLYFSSNPITILLMVEWFLYKFTKTCIYRKEIVCVSIGIDRFGVIRLFCVIIRSNGPLQGRGTTRGLWFIIQIFWCFSCHLNKNFASHLLIVIDLCVKENDKTTKTLKYSSWESK